MSRSRYLQARDGSCAAAVVEAEASGRGRSSTLVLAFAEAGPWWEGEINVELLEAVLGYSAATGVARLLLAAMAAIADADGAVGDFTTEQICAAAGIAAKSYQRAKNELLASGELTLVNGVGGRGNTNAWFVSDPRARNGAVAQRARGRVRLHQRARPLVGVARSQAGARAVEASGSGDGEKGGQDQTVSPQNRLRLTGLSKVKGSQDQTLSDPAAAESPAQRVVKRVVKTRAVNARAGSEPLNPRTGDPPTPPKGGEPADRVLIEQPFISERGRKRRRMVPVDLAEVRRGLDPPGPADRAEWELIRELLRARLGDDLFAIWLGPLELIAAARELAGVELSLVGEMGRELFLRDALEPLLVDYDDVVVDTPPNLGLLTVNALVCADRVLAPVSAEDEASLHGIVELRQTIARLSERLGVPIPSLVALLTRWQRHRISSREMEDALIAEALGPVGRIPSRSALISRAAARRVPVALSAPDSSPAVAYASLAEILMEVSAR